MNHLIISEQFYSLQGEGQTMGVPSIFIRLAGCNLLCKSDHWVCDSIEVWKKGIKTEFQDVLDQDMIKRLEEGTHLIFTGGEPMLHQTAILNFLKWFKKKYHFKPIVEIETNGTRIIDHDLFKLIDFINCSPKLENSGEPIFRRFNEQSLTQISNHIKSIFKFVISHENDIDEIIKDFNCIDLNKVVLMPAGEDQDQLNETRMMVVNKCLEMGWKYCDRLHIIIWNKKTGV